MFLLFWVLSKGYNFVFEFPVLTIVNELFF